MYISRVFVKGFRSLQNVEANLTNYSTLIGKNDSGKSSFLRALQVLFDANAPFQETDRCKFLSDGEECFIEATLKDCSIPLEEIISSEITIKRTHSGKQSQWLYKGKTPELDILKRMASGDCTATDIKNDATLPKDLRDFAVSKLSGRLTKESCISIFEDLKENYSIDFEEGWMPFDAGKLSSIVQVVMLEADARGEEQVVDSNRSIFSRVGSLLLHESIKRHAGITGATENLRKEIEIVSQKDGDNKWTIQEFNDFEEILSEEVKKFDSSIEAQPTLIPPKIPLVQFSVKIQIKDEWVEGIDKMGHGARRSFVFAMLRVHKRLQEKSFTTTDATSQNGISPLYLFLFEEPELYLHPQAERRRMHELKELSDVENAQVVLCTHSAIFVDLSQYEGILKFDRPNRKETSVQNWKGQDLKVTDKKTLSKIYRFDPSKSAMLFADLAILVEGRSEKICVPHIAEKIEIDTSEVEVVDCDGNGSIPIFQQILEGFGIKYVAWLDLDPNKQGDIDVVTTAKQIKGGFGKIVISPIDWESLAGISTNKKEKAYSSWRHFVFEDNEPNEKVKARIQAAYNWEDYENDPISSATGN